MTTVATRNPARKSTTPRSVKVLIPLAPESCGVVRITEGRKVDDYYLARQDTDDATEKGYRLTKLADGGESYDVAVSGGFYTCECKGYLRHGQCRHGALLLALENAGKL